MTGNLYQDWPVYVLLGAVAFFFVFVVVNSRRQERKAKEKSKQIMRNK